MVDLELKDITELKMDIKELEYVSSAGLRVLLAATKKMKAKGDTIAIYHANEEVMVCLPKTIGDINDSVDVGLDWYHVALEKDVSIGDVC